MDFANKCSQLLLLYKKKFENFDGRPRVWWTLLPNRNWLPPNGAVAKFLVRGGRYYTVIVIVAVQEQPLTLHVSQRQLIGLVGVAATSFVGETLKLLSLDRY